MWRASNTVISPSRPNVCFLHLHLRLLLLIIPPSSARSLCRSIAPTWCCASVLLQRSVAETPLVFQIFNMSKHNSLESSASTPGLTPSQNSNSSTSIAAGSGAFEQDLKRRSANPFATPVFATPSPSFVSPTPQSGYFPKGESGISGRRRLCSRLTNKRKSIGTPTAVQELPARWRVSGSLLALSRNPTDESLCRFEKPWLATPGRHINWDSVIFYTFVGVGLGKLRRCRDEMSSYSHKLSGSSCGPYLLVQYKRCSKA